MPRKLQGIWKVYARFTGVVSKYSNNDIITVMTSLLLPSLQNIGGFPDQPPLPPVATHWPDCTFLLHANILKKKPS